MIVEILSSPQEQGRLGEVLLAQLRDTRWSEFRAAVAFVKRSGVQHLGEAIRDFARRGSVRISVGVDFGGTSQEGMTELLRCAGDGHAWVFHNTNGSTFHPKLYLFRNDAEAFVVVGSGNLNQGGLFTNYEASIALGLDWHWRWTDICSTGSSVRSTCGSTRVGVHVGPWIPTFSTS